ncbi:MAG: hypothetical protein SGI90_05605 [Candidatus Eisenbacteria bacterium]|nr:hypothetical protein [Candidatus Eisenbacteria bacterium]
MKKKAVKARSGQVSDGMRPEYDFSKGVRGKHAARYAAGTNVVVLDPDVAKAFPTANMVNEALRLLMSIAGRRKTKPTRTRSGTS